MSQVEKGNTVKVHYTGKLDDGAVFDSSEGRDPLEFVVGGGNMIKGFDAAVVGMTHGETKTVTIASGEAYGSYRDDMVMIVDRSNMPEGMEPQIGMQLEMKSPEGQTFVVTIVEVNDDTVKLDGNHPLAGKDLTFEIMLAELN